MYIAEVPIYPYLSIQDKVKLIEKAREQCTGVVQNSILINYSFLKSGYNAEGSWLHIIVSYSYT